MYHRVTAEERRLIYRWGQEGDSIREVARRLGRSPGSISREIRRNRGKKGYRHQQAHAKAQAKAKRQVRRCFMEVILAYAEPWLREEGWTPQIICERARDQGLPSVCKETLYRYIYTDAKAGGTLWHYLTRARKGNFPGSVRALGPCRRKTGKPK